MEKQEVYFVIKFNKDKKSTFLNFIFIFKINFKNLKILKKCTFL